ncbi:hypothetical protein PIB30_027887 [Stylosanthes scabra]|uniref:Methyltransferase type 11 domain-containing protein n=2 Tax=Stylosanthes scabra TaxID=79078 RepID=A0ABU6XCL2_9FABA|nr:hypothetical protein [Stylosanthes scabra]
MASRPELVAPPEIFYDDAEARKYTSSSRIIEIQASLSERALELLDLPDDGIPKLLLDIGCGSGLSGEILSENGHHWIGLDISPSMLNVAIERDVEGDLLLGDMGQGLGLRPGVIDGVISISAVQWLCNADKSSHNPILRLKAFFNSLYRCLANGARAAFQIYPENINQRELILKAAMHAGFAGGIVVDYPHSTKKRKEFLVLTCGQRAINSMPEVPSLLISENLPTTTVRPHRVVAVLCRLVSAVPSPPWSARPFWLAASTRNIIKLNKRDIMAVHSESGSQEKKSSNGVNELLTFNAENMQNNMKIIYYSRTFLSIIGGVVAGILGFTGLKGFVFYLLLMAVTSVVLVAKAKFSIQTYFDSWNRVLLDGFLGGLMSFVLFWTFAYDIVHIF